MPDKIMPSCSILCDFDGPILDTDTLIHDKVEWIAGKNPKKQSQFWEFYEQYKSDMDAFLHAVSGAFAIPFETLHHSYYEEDILKYVRPEATDFLQSVRQFATVEVVTKGDPEFQTSKLDRVNIHGRALEDKTTYLVQRIIENAHEGLKTLVIDDKVKELQQVFEKLPHELHTSVQFFHFAVGRHKDIRPSQEFDQHMITIHHFSEVEEFFIPYQGVEGSYTHSYRK